MLLHSVVANISSKSIERVGMIKMLLLGKGLLKPLPHLTGAHDQTKFQCQCTHWKCQLKLVPVPWLTEKPNPSSTTTSRHIL